MTRVVKLGGSLLSAGVLPACLDALGGWGESLVIVPGGGEFADQVRRSQAIWNFDDVTAHRMALLAMRQMGWLMHARRPQFQPADSVATLAEVLSAKRSAIWMPDHAELDAAGVEASWEVTSDSLAAWLAGRLDAGELILVKSAEVADDTDIGRLIGQGIVDSAFGRYSRDAGYRIRIIHQASFINA
ncbi:uridylate kinase [Methylomonas sp. LWB]|uniref:amino acid kinase family protein n=1 Tax=Methylomonas sp. LWB TaxID=1905845 RepID=UPI0008DB29C8|nr:uridylate kinase [Methylomonas sp. LWB]OHX37298.1 uridylate kinase [Methylomonas sp. LWB]